MRGPYRPTEYRKVMPPTTVLRLGCVLEFTKAKVLEEQKGLKGQNAAIADKMLRRAAKAAVLQHQQIRLSEAPRRSRGLAQNLLHYIQAFAGTRALFDNFGFDQQIQKLDKSPRRFAERFLRRTSERDETAVVCTDADGNPEPDPELRDIENVPLKEDIHDYFEREVKPHIPAACVDEDKTKIGCEIPLTRR